MEIPWQKRKKLEHIQLHWAGIRSEKKIVSIAQYLCEVFYVMFGFFIRPVFFPSRFEQPRYTSANNIALDAVPLSCLFITYLHSLWCMLNIAQAPLVTVNTNNSREKSALEYAHRSLSILVYSAYAVHVQLLCLCIIIKSMNAVAFPLYLIMNQWMEVE